jgi:ectoine hydroxylase-related dioxygenase (phytanoyl-CoA dioxygenase family)
MLEVRTADLTRSSDAELGDFIRKNGAFVLRGLIDADSVKLLKGALVGALDQDDASYGRGYKFRGMVHALMSRGQAFLDLLGNKAIRRISKSVLGHGCIVHAYNSSSMPPGATNYSRTIHVDSPRLIPGYVTNIGVTLALDPFNAETGGMEIMPLSFDFRDAPDEPAFQKGAEQPLLAPGDAILFNARCWHRGGMNRTENWRHAVSMNICRSYMRQQFDYPRMLDQLSIDGLDEDRRQFLGYYVRQPSSMAEFLLPAEQRLYRPGQE